MSKGNDESLFPACNTCAYKYILRTRKHALSTQRKAYIAEFMGTALMVGFGLFAVAVFWSSGSPLAELPLEPGPRRLVTGFFFAGGATIVIYSPLGQLSGGHVNPSVTLGFLSLGKISRTDAAAYVASQLAGAVAGVGLLSALVLGVFGWGDAIAVGATQPGPGFPVPLVFTAEVLITFILMLAILLISNRRRIAQLTPAIAGTIVMTEVWLEAHVSGTSLNAARSLAPAVFSGIWEHHWIYWTAPIIGAQCAALAYRLAPRTPPVLCCKLYHTDRYRCHHAACRVAPEAGGQAD